MSVFCYDLADECFHIGCHRQFLVLSSHHEIRCKAHQDIKYCCCTPKTNLHAERKCSEQGTVKASCHGHKESQCLQKVKFSSHSVIIEKLCCHSYFVTKETLFSGIVNMAIHSSSSSGLMPIFILPQSSYPTKLPTSPDNGPFATISWSPL